MDGALGRAAVRRARFADNAEALAALAPAPVRFLHRIHPGSRRLTFVDTDTDALADTTFLDGRTMFWTGSPESSGFAPALADAEPCAAGLERSIFHFSFCGSTLLAWLLGEASNALVLKEPQCLVDLADWKKTLDIHNAADADFTRLLDYARASLGRSNPAGGPVVVKPSNWANNLLPVFADRPRPHACLCITIDPRAFIVAVFRGGRDRLAFTARVASHLASTVDHGPRLVQRAMAAGGDPLGCAANMAALAYALQMRLFDDAGEQASRRIDFADIAEDLEAAVHRAAAALAIEVTDRSVRNAVDHWRARDAKSNGIPFSAWEQRQADAEIEQAYGGYIAGALTLLEQSLLPALRRSD